MSASHAKALEAVRARADGGPWTTTHGDAALEAGLGERTWRRAIGALAARGEVLARQTRHGVVLELAGGPEGHAGEPPSPPRAAGDDARAVTPDENAKARTDTIGPRTDVRTDSGKKASRDLHSKSFERDKKSSSRSTTTAAENGHDRPGRAFALSSPSRERETLELVARALALAVEALGALATLLGGLGGVSLPVNGSPSTLREPPAARAGVVHRDVKPENVHRAENVQAAPAQAEPDHGSSVFANTERERATDREEAIEERLAEYQAAVAAGEASVTSLSGLRNHLRKSLTPGEIADLLSQRKARLAREASLAKAKAELSERTERARESAEASRAAEAAARARAAEVARRIALLEERAPADLEALSARAESLALERALAQGHAARPGSPTWASRVTRELEELVLQGNPIHEGATT